MTELSQKERLIFEYISDCLEKNGYAPTVRDICSALGIKSTSSVHDYLRRLETKGYIKKSSGKSRALSIESGAGMEPEKMKKIPILGRVAAGIPILAIENYDGYVDFPASMARGKSNLFALRVIGESMIEAGINDGDIIIIHRGMSVESGEIGVVRVSGESATLKRVFYENGNKIRLQPENSSMQPIIVDINDVEIVGKLIGLYREY
jgi:repressor LexA